MSLKNQPVTAQAWLGYHYMYVKKSGSTVCLVTTFTHKSSLVRIDARNFELSW